MCSCSGNCNCNSTTIPRGPQGQTGATGPIGPPGLDGNDGTSATIEIGDVESGSPAAVTNSGTSNAAIFNFTIPPGTPGSDGTNGIDGKNSYSLTGDEFIQPDVNSTVSFIEVTDFTWMSYNQIVFVGNPTGSTNIGGYYQVVNKVTVGSVYYVTLLRLDWTIPGVTFVSTGNSIPAASLIHSSGTIGAPASNLTYIQESFWGIESGNGGSNDYKYGILVPEDTLVNDYDALECQTIICINAETSSLGRLVEIKISTTNDNDGVNAIVFNIPNTVTSGRPVTYAHINYKIQKISDTTFRSTGECFVGDEETSTLLLTQTSSNNYICTSTAAITLDNSSNWGNDQYIVVVANDTATPDISVRHHQVKVTKIKI